ncbi:PREDICTED: uncharacterized protein LOC104740888 [Camelina sativa]|uniref:Uncharacterized protein LOC104700522 n=1 Tax=Camelina sativa TaxID=90675 RepID=A0ABM0SPT3_CAMSA|nr:PREDICTED: uncharacterized protein LOC104700522 [Camelina sativa]XP_010414352.1 PREDICTED: uncharacterized protein LOC104700525 [Camelina sativa]XP_010459916.1 PREDICTED: uncharacterized protein LOC104740888 [Camelina sativa]
MAVQMSKRICNILMIITLCTMMFSAQVAHSNKRALDVCLRNCVTNVCMKTGKKATPAKCSDACKQVCDGNPYNSGEYFVPGDKSPVKRFCEQFPWIC